MKGFYDHSNEKHILSHSQHKIDGVLTLSAIKFVILEFKIFSWAMHAVQGNIVAEIVSFLFKNKTAYFWVFDWTQRRIGKAEQRKFVLRPPLIDLTDHLWLSSLLI